jgi:preprotein translocase subunit SecD
MFLIYTYRLSGLVASLSLLIYVIIILVVVKSTGTVLTLASIA